MNDDVKINKVDILFVSHKTQIIFEFIYLVVIFILACTLLLCINLKFLNIPHESTIYLYSVIGGFLGGWTYDVRWFYRSICDNSNACMWKPKKLYWRILSPFVGALVAFAFYTLTISDIIPFFTLKVINGPSAYGLSYIVGYSSDRVMKALRKWLENSLKKIKITETENDK